MMRAAEKVRSPGDIGSEADKCGVGVSAMVDNPSPFPWINRLRGWFLEECPCTVDSERAELVNEAYRKYENEPQLIRVANALAHVLRNF